MQKRILAVTVFFALLLVAIVVSANANVLPLPLKQLTRLPGGDKTGHFVLFGILSYLFNKSALYMFRERNPARLVLTVSLLLAILIGLEEWSQSLFPTRTMSISDLMASYAGVSVFALLAYKAP